MKKILKFSGHAVLLTALIAEGGFAQNAWINEIHYDNANSDVNESVEVVIQDAETYNLADFSLLLYNGGNGTSYNTKTLDLFTAGITSDGYSFFYYIYPTNGMQNGAPDGLALAYQGTLINGQFLSYEGTFTGTNGPANGLLSIDIGVSEPGTDPVGNSLQLSGTGWFYENFLWIAPAMQTAGQLNNNQAFGEPPVPEPSDYPLNFSCDIVGLVAHLEWTDSAGGQAPENYLVIASDADSIISPPDGELYPDDPDLDDGSGSLNVSFGTQSCMFYRLSGDKTFYFKIFPYTNTGSGVNYKTDSDPPSAHGLTSHEINRNNFEDGTSGTWEIISVASDKDWSVVSTGGAYLTSSFCKMDATGENVPGNDWLISPSLDFTFSTDEMMEFHSQWRSGITNSELTLKYSMDYFGGNPEQASWNELEFTRPADSLTWASSGIIDLSGINGDNVHISLQFESNGTPRQWGIDEIEITGIPLESTINVTSPVEGSQWERSTFQDISWTAENNQANMRIEFTGDASSDDPTWIVLNPSVPASAGTWVWDIPASQAAGNDCQIKVTDIASRGEGLSGIFTIVPSSIVPRLVITEIMYNPPESGSDTLEFLELYNEDEIAINLEGFYFSQGITFTFPYLVLEPGTFSILSIDTAIFKAAYGMSALEYSGSLSNNGETIVLLNSYDLVVDSLAFDDTSPWPTEPDGEGPSLSLWAPGLDNTLPENWRVSNELAYINANGDSLFATPGWANMILPQAEFSGSPVKLYEGEAVDFTDLSTGSANSWYWEFEGGVPSTSTDQNPSGILYPAPGLYDIKLTVTNLSGSDILLKEDYIDVMPVGIDEQKINSFSIYPNPNNGSFCLVNPYYESMTGSIYSSYGEFINIININPGLNSVEIIESGGIYFIRIESSNGKIRGYLKMMIN